MAGIEEPLLELYRNLRLLHYRNLFGQLREKTGSVSATEAFSAEVIYLLDRPTIGQFADYLGVSQPNASYKVASLVAKGYLARESGDDRREARLCVTEKFMEYYGSRQPSVKRALVKALRSFSAAERALLFRLCSRINACLAAEI